MFGSWRLIICSAWKNCKCSKWRSWNGTQPSSLQCTWKCQNDNIENNGSYPQWKPSNYCNLLIQPNKCKWWSASGKILWRTNISDQADPKKKQHSNHWLWFQCTSLTTWWLQICLSLSNRNGSMLKDYLRITFYTSTHCSRKGQGFSGHTDHQIGTRYNWTMLSSVRSGRTMQWTVDLSTPLSVLPQITELSLLKLD